jgi:hypothetical protein
MGTNLEPINGIAFPDSYSTIASPNSYRINGLLCINTFKMEAGIMRIYFEKTIRFFCLFLNMQRQSYKQFIKLFGSFVLHSTAKPPSSVSFSASCRKASAARRRSAFLTWFFLTIDSHSRSSSISMKKAELFSRLKGMTMDIAVVVAADASGKLRVPTEVAVCGLILTYSSILHFLSIFC